MKRELCNRVFSNNAEKLISSIALILMIIFMSQSSLFTYLLSAPPILSLKWTKSGLGNGFWEGGVAIGDVVKSNPGEEIVCATDYNGGTVWVLDDADGKTLWTYTDSAIYAYAQISLYDIDADGNLEIIVPLYYPPGILVLRGDGTRYWRTLISGSSGTIMSSVAAADTDGDGKLEIFAGSQNVEAGLDKRFTGKIVKLSYDGRILAETFTWRACSGGISIADADNDGELEIYAGDRHMYMGDGDYGKGVRSFWASNLTQRWCHPDILCSSQCPVLADVTGDGKMEAIVSDQRGGLIILNSTSGSAIRKSRNIGLPGHYQLTVYDIDGDGCLEVLTADGTHESSRWSNTEVVIFDLVNWKVDGRLPVGKCKFSPTLADLTGDGKMDIIACNMTTVFIYTYDSQARKYVKVEEFSNLSEGLMYAIVQDTDNDGYLEMVVPRGSGSNAKIYFFDTTAPKPQQRVRSEVKWYSEYRRGTAEYIPPPKKTNLASPTYISGEWGVGAISGIISVGVTGSFGKTNVGGSYVNLCQYTYGSKYQITEDGVAQSITLYVRERNNEPRTLKVAIYNDTAGVPSRLLAQGTTTIPAGHNGWITVSLSTQPVLKAGNYYWLIANAQASGKIVNFYFNAGETSQAMYATTSLSSFPTDPCQFSGFRDRAFSIYCTYEKSGPTPPKVVGHSPSNGEVNVPINTVIQVTFSETMNKTSVESSFSLGVVSGSFSWNADETIMTFTPSGNLAYDTTYTVIISGDAQDKEGESMGSPYTWSFRTVSPLPTLTSSDGTHSTNADLICYSFDTSARNIFNWYVNNVSLTNLLLTFDINDPPYVRDYSPYNNNGKVYGATWSNNGILGGAYYFDGFFDYIRIPDGGLGYFPGYPTPSKLGGDGTWSEITIELWVYIEPNQNPGAKNPPVSDVRFLSKIPSYEMGIDTSKRLFAGIWTQNGTDYTELGSFGSSRIMYTTPLTDQVWHHVSLTYRNGVGLSLYLNGQRVGFNGQVRGNVHCSSGEPLVLGWFDYFHGMIDEVRIYPRCLSSDQVYQRYIEVKEGWNDRAVIKAADTKGLEVWKCQVIQGSISRFSNPWEIDNTPPSALNLKIGPRESLQPLVTDTLFALYQYFDADEKPESGSEIRWYKNGVLQPSLNNSRTVPSSALLVGDVWRFSVRPKDGVDFGSLSLSPNVTVIANSPPQVVSAGISLDGSGNLNCISQTYDADSDVVRSVFNWYVNNAPLATLIMPFDTDSMFTAKDYSPPSTNGVISSPAWTPNGLLGGAYVFDGNDIIIVADDSSLGGDGTWSEITIEFWIKLSEDQWGSRVIAKKLAGSSTGSYMVGFQTSTSDPANALFFGVTVDGVWYDTWSNVTAQANMILEVNKWNHVVCTYKSGLGLIVYINGTRRASLPLSGLISVSTPTIGDEPLFIGSDGSGRAYRFIKGIIDEVRIYRRALSSRQVQQLYLESSKDGLSGRSTIISTEIRKGDTWKCVVTPNDKYQDGSVKETNSIAI
ncbi:MAG: LamG-like jellyroll fold domain-containing protein [Candidatus Bathyarchaeia archaeon]